MSVGVCVGEESRLKDWIGRWLNTWYQVRGVVSNLLDLGEVVDGVLIQSKFTNLLARELALGPDVGQVEDVNLLFLPNFLSLLWCHGLNLNIPLGEFATLDGLVQILL